jgi:hypothetical protein
MDSDCIILKNMDWLFGVPEADLSAPRAYWLDPGVLKPGCGSTTWKANDGPQVGLQMKFTSAVMVVNPRYGGLSAVSLWVRSCVCVCACVCACVVCAMNTGDSGRAERSCQQLRFYLFPGAFHRAVHLSCAGAVWHTRMRLAPQRLQPWQILQNWQ